MASSRDKLLNFSRRKTAHICDDYREFLELSTVFLGGTPVRGIKFTAPGARHSSLAWNMAPQVVGAPWNNFHLMKELMHYQHQGISITTSKKLSLHLWYLEEELVGLAFFDDRVPVAMKKLIIEALEEDAVNHPPMSLIISLSAFVDDSKGLEQLVTRSTKAIFTHLQLLGELFLKDPESWLVDSFNKALRDMETRAVVNDRAERGVALIQESNKKLTR